MKNVNASPASVLRFIWFLGLTLLVHYFVSGQRYWVSTTGGLWSNAANWSATSGGAGGAGAPAGVPAIFDGVGGSNGNCTIDAAVNVTGITFGAGFSGSVSQGNFAINVTGNSVLSGGTFIGGSGLMTNTGTFNINGGNFTCPSTTLSIGNSFTFSSGNFSHNNGTVIFYNTSLSTSGSPIFYNLKFTANSNVFTINNSFTVAGDLYFNSVAGVTEDVNIAATSTIAVLGNIYLMGPGLVRMNTGTIAAYGDLIITNTNTAGGGTGTFLMTGTANQSISNSGTIAQGRIPSVVINKSAGSLSLTGTITVIGPNWNYISGTLIPGTSVLNFSKVSGGSNIVVSGVHTLYDAIFSSSFGNITINNDLTIGHHLTVDGASASNDVNINSSLTVLGTLYMTGTQNIRYNTGILDAKGDIINTNVGPVGGGTGTVSITGTGNQLWSCSGGDGYGSFPNILINKPSGVLSLSGIVSSCGPKWTYSAGTIAPGTSTVCLYDGGAAPITMSGDHTLNDFILYPLYSTNVINSNLTLNNCVIDGSSDHNVTIGSTVTVNGKLTINGTGQVRLNNGIVNAKGNILTTNTSNLSGGTATLIINGTTNQTITGTGVALQSRLPNTVQINKTGGGVYIGSSAFYFYGLIVFTQGYLYSTTSQLVWFYSGCTWTSANSASFVDGPVRKRGNTAFNFPIGKAGVYAPIRISAPSNIAHHFTAEYFNANPNPSYNVLLKDASLSNVSICEYWILDRTNGTSNVSVTPSWDFRSCGIGNMADLRVARWDGGMWKDHGNGGTSGSLAAGTITTSALVTSFSPFTLASISSSNPLPIDETNFRAECADNIVKLSWKIQSGKNQYSILKSTDAIEWNAIKNISDLNNFEGQEEFTFSDYRTDNSPVYYRLKETDNTNHLSYSQSVFIDECGSENTLSIRYTSISGVYNINSAEANEQLQVYDASGKLITSLALKEKNFQLDISSQPSGLYLIRLLNKNETYKLIK